MDSSGLTSSGLILLVCLSSLLLSEAFSLQSLESSREVAYSLELSSSCLSYCLTHLVTDPHYQLDGLLPL